MVCFLSFSDRNMTKVFGSVTFEKCAEPEWSRSQVNFRNVIIIQCMLKRNNPVDAKNLYNVESILIAAMIIFILLIKIYVACLKSRLASCNRLD